MRRVFKTKPFIRQVKKSEINDEILCDAVEEMSQGLIDADLGHGVFKKRVRLPGRGKRGSARTILATNLFDRWFFIFGYDKNSKANIKETEKVALAEFSELLLSFNEKGLDQALLDGYLLEICL